MSVPTRKLGANGPQVTALGLGLMGLSMAYGTKKPDSERLAFLDHAFAAGERNWDTSSSYGDCELLLGQWFKQNPGKRNEVFLATKFGSVTNPDGSRGVDNRPEWVRESCENSLRRLGTDYIDLFYCHRLSGEVPVETVVEAMAKLKAEGKVKYLGLSEVSAATLRRASKVAHIDAVQMEYSPFAMEIEHLGLLDAARETGTAIIAYSPLGRGFVNGKYRSHDDLPEGDFRRVAPRYSKENFPKNLKLVDLIHELATKKSVTAGQLTLAWLVSKFLQLSRLY
jgi:aryl-alcohol dehydrogenase-like predicted oxidoreductase